MKGKLFALALAMLLLLLTAACGTQAPPPPAEEAPPAEAAAASPTVDTDRAGNPIELPETIETILSLGPSNTEILTALGFGDKIIGTDSFSTDIPGLPAELPLFDMMSPDGEQMIALAPDVIFVTGMMQVDGLDPLGIVRDAGITVIYTHSLRSSESIAGIIEDIRFIAAVMGASEQGEAIVREMESEVARIRAIAATISERKTVYFEIDAPPFMFSFGRGVFLHEMLEIIGAENVFADQNQWFSVADEAVLERNPDVILTNVSYLDDPVGDILNRLGWESITAVSEGRVYVIDANASSRPSHNVVRALEEMARAVYPAYFG